MRTIFLVGSISIFIGLTGCSGFVRNMVDTQPRVQLSAGDYETPNEIVHGDAIVYESGAVSIEGEADGDLVRFAPIIVQGFQERLGDGGAYDYASDAIGAPSVKARGDKVWIDTESPEVYARLERTYIQGEELKQLVYVFWYPERPVGSIEKGDIDGGILRMTLDSNGAPAVFEYSQPCGCFHGVFVSSALEQEAQREFGVVAPKRIHATEPPLTGDDDWVVRDVIDVTPDSRPVLYMSAGSHFCEAIRFTDKSESLAPDAKRIAYTLKPYDFLERAPKEGGGVASIFNNRGLVRGGERWKEEFILADLEYPGWPRHLDHMLIHWDKEQWNDPYLLEGHLRLPHVMTGARAETTNATQATNSFAEASSNVASSPSGRALLLFTNRYCLGCQQAKQQINETPDIQAAIREVPYEVIDTATLEGAQLAAEHHVSRVPVLLVMDEDIELYRSEDIGTPEKLLAAITHQ